MKNTYKGSAEIRRMSVRKGTKGKRELQGKAYCRMSVCGPCDIQRSSTEVGQSVTEGDKEASRCGIWEGVCGVARDVA